MRTHGTKQYWDKNITWTGLGSIYARAVEKAKGNTAQRDEGNCASTCALLLPCTAQQNGVVLVLSLPCLFFWLLSCERLSATRCILKFFV